MRDEARRQGRNLKDRTKDFALAVIRLYGKLPQKMEARTIGNQVLKSGTLVGAHYREAQRAKSNADFISKMEGGLQELEETQYWLELLAESGLVLREDLSDLEREVNELLAIFVSIVNKTKSKTKQARV